MDLTLRVSTANQVIVKATDIFNFEGSKQELVASLMKQAHGKGRTALVLVQAGFQASKGLSTGYKAWKDTENHNYYEVVNCIGSCENTVKGKFKNAREFKSDLADIIDNGLEIFENTSNNTDSLTLEGYALEISNLTIGAKIDAFKVIEINEAMKELRRIKKLVTDLIPPVDVNGEQIEDTDTDTTTDEIEVNETDDPGVKEELDLAAAIELVISLCKNELDGDIAIARIATALGLEKAA